MPSPYEEVFCLLMAKKDVLFSLSCSSIRLDFELNVNLHKIL